MGKKQRVGIQSYQRGSNHNQLDLKRLRREMEGILSFGVEVKLMNHRSELTFPSLSHGSCSIVAPKEVARIWSLHWIPASPSCILRNKTPQRTTGKERLPPLCMNYFRLQNNVAVKCKRKKDPRNS